VSNNLRLRTLVGDGDGGIPGDPLGPLAKAVKDVLAHLAEGDDFSRTGQVAYGSTELSQDTLVARILDGNRRNTYAAARYIDGNGDAQVLVEHSTSAGHAESRILDRLRDLGVDPSEGVKDLYVEFQPCGRCEKNYLPEYGNVNITWSFPWSTDPDVQIRSQAERSAAIRDLWP
jgi:hypothetical protein